ncbi:MAG: glycoside hydrolase, partial [Rhodothermaeota bacterium MED-G12]
MKKIIILSFSILFLLYNNLFSQELRLNDLEYFENNGVNYLVYNNLFTGGFNDEKNAGIEIIHHGIRSIQGGAIRLSNTPEQWDLVPIITNRIVDKENGRIEANLRYEEFDFESIIVVESKGKGIEITIHLDEVLPEELENKAGFNLEFLPSQYWGKTYLMNDRINIFPHYAVGNSITKPNDQKIRQYKGYSTSDDRGTARYIDPLPLEKGNELVIAPEDPRRMVTIKSVDNDLMLFDGRILA